MGIKVTINSLTGTSPYDVYICQSGGTSCFYISTIVTGDLPYIFDIPSPYNNGDSYMVKVVDDENCVITGITSIAYTVTPTPTPTVTPSISLTPSLTPTNTVTPTSTTTQTPTPTVTKTLTPTPTRTPTMTATPSVCTTQITINWGILTCARGTFSILVNGSSVYIKNALGIAGSGSDTITVPYGSTITLDGSATNVSGGGCVGIYDTSSINMTPSFGGANGVSIVRISDGTPNSFSYSYTKTCPTTVITLDYVPNPI
jgi:hypothetical protein